jgi:hypothetical protein
MLQKKKTVVKQIKSDVVATAVLSSQHAATKTTVVSKYKIILLLPQQPLADILLQ